MKTCVVTANYACDSNKVWLYLTKPTLNHWCTGVTQYDEASDGMQVMVWNEDGSLTKIIYSVKEKPRRISCDFQKGKINGSFTAILLGGVDSTSLECTLEVDGLGLFAKPQKLLENWLEMLRNALGA